jgi:DNA-binding XRE family transcriptional regulator
MTHEEAIRELGPCADLLTLELRAMRATLGLTQVQMATMLSMKPRTYIRTEQGVLRVKDQTMLVARLILAHAQRLATARRRAGPPDAHHGALADQARTRESPHTEATRAKQRAARRAKRQAHTIHQTETQP